MSDSALWFTTLAKLRFFSRIRRFIKSKAIKADNFKYPILKESTQSIPEVLMVLEKTEEEVHESEEESIVLQRSVKRLHFGNWEEKVVAAMEIRRLAENNLKLKTTMAELGVIPSLVSMAESDIVGRTSVALQALIQLANGSYTNKVLMVEAGILTKLPGNIEIKDELVTYEFSQLLLSISSLANSQFPLTSPHVLPFLITVLESNSSFETKELCLGTMHNFSTMLENAGPLVTNGSVRTLINMCSVKETSEKSLATLGNLVVTLMGKKAMENNPLVPNSLIEILTWEDKPKCQELSAYILMILAHQSSAQRQKMARSGIVPVLLEVALLGSELAQKRTLKLLQWFKDERQAKMGPHSGPQTAQLKIGSPLNEKEVQVGKKLMKKMVKESLNKNMEVIIRRANTCSEDEFKVKALVISSSSKSLPY